MKKSSLNIEKYICTVNNSKYVIYLIPEENNLTGFYIQKNNYGLLSLAVGLNIKLLECSIEDFINNNITEWIEIYEDSIDKLENYYNPNMEI